MPPSCAQRQSNFRGGGVNSEVAVIFLLTLFIIALYPYEIKRPFNQDWSFVFVYGSNSRAWIWWKCK